MDENRDVVKSDSELKTSEYDNTAEENVESKECDIISYRENIRAADEPGSKSDACFDGASQEGAVDEFLAGDDDMTLPSIEQENDIEFKTEIVLDYDGVGAIGPVNKTEKNLFEEGNDEHLEDLMPLQEEKTINENGQLQGHSSDSNGSAKMKIMEDEKEETQPESPPADNTESNNSDEISHTKKNLTDDTILNIKAEDIDNMEQADNSEVESPEKKRKIDEEDDSVKRIRNEIHENFHQRDKLLNELLEIMECDNIDQLKGYSEQIVSEIKILNDLAKEKEAEWNNIIHLKKLKEELLIRLERRKQLTLLNGEKIEDCNDFAEMYIKNNQSILRSNLSKSPRNDRSPKQKTYNGLDLRQGIKRPLLDVQSIIADYRQRHPETVPRRGRRIRSGGQNGTNGSGLNFSASVGSNQVRQNDLGSNLDVLLNILDNSRNDNLSVKERNSIGQENASFHEMIVQLAKLSQNERNEILHNAIKPPPPYPEVTVHPVTSSPPTNSLLHGILTKTASSKPNNKTSFSPTLARLLTAPERSGSNHVTPPSITGHLSHSPNMSLSDILSTSKTRNEITITPVGSQMDGSLKGKTEDEEAEDSADRLVIDESNEMEGKKGDAGSDIGDEVPQCQGCHQKTAQFVCAGCGNQWYCSRDCQVVAWDEHSEVCSG